MKKNLMIAITLFLLNIPLLFLHIYILNLVWIAVSFYFFVNAMLSNINILNKECKPDLFFSKNKNKKSQYLNCCFALLHSNMSNKEELFLEYLDKAKKKKIKGNVYLMKLDYLELNYKILMNKITENDELEFEENWLNNKYLSRLERKNINFFLKNKRHQCILTSVIFHFQNAVNFYENEIFDMAKTDFLYVQKFGGTTIYAFLAEKYLKDLNKHTINKKIKADKIRFVDKYKLNKNLIDACFCIYLFLFIIQLQIFNILFH